MANDQAANSRYGALRAVYDQPYLLLILTALAWSGNAVASRMAVGEISPMLLTAGRWSLVLAVVGVIGREAIARNGPRLRVQWRGILAMGACGFTAFNALFYLAGHLTSAINIAILQGTIPVIVMLGALALHRTPIKAGQALGMLITLGGVLIVASHGDLAGLAQLRFNPGDLLMLIACVLYAGYTLGLRGREGVSTIWFFSGLAAAALITALPLAAAELALGQAQVPTWRGWAILLYVALAPSFVAQLFYMRAVQLIGPSRAGLFVNLVPVFGPLLAVLLIGEPFRPHHALALSLVLLGIALAERSARRALRRAPA
jgi:drug/metabolite transporter (DMT)-like permease